MNRLDLPTFSNGGGLLLALVLLGLALAFAAWIDSRRPRCHICSGRTRLDPDRIVRTISGRYVVLCRICHNRTMP